MMDVPFIGSPWFGIKNQNHSTDPLSSQPLPRVNPIHQSTLQHTMPMHKWHASEPSKLACSAAKILAGLTTPDSQSPTTGDVYAMLSAHGDYSSDWRGPTSKSRHERPKKKLPSVKKLGERLKKIGAKLKSITSSRKDDLDDEMSTEELIKLVNEIRFHNYGNGSPVEEQVKITSRDPASTLQTCSTGLRVPGKRQNFETPGFTPSSGNLKVSGISHSLENSTISESWERFINRGKLNNSTTSLSSQVSTNSASWGSSTSSASWETSGPSTSSKTSSTSTQFGELLESLEFYRDPSGLFARRGDCKSEDWLKLSAENEELIDSLEFFQDASGLFAKWVEKTSPQAWFRLTSHFPDRSWD